MLFTYLSRFGELSDDFKHGLEIELTQLSLPKSYLLHEAPRVAEHGYFLNRGFAHSYCYDEGRKITEAIWKEGQPMVSFTSFIEQVPSLDSIQMVTAGEVLFLSYPAMQRLRYRYADGQRLYQLFITSQYEICQQRIHDIQRLGAYARFEKLVSSIPEAEQLFSQDAIASYLNITPQSLSRIKRERNRTNR